MVMKGETTCRDASRSAPVPVPIHGRGAAEWGPARSQGPNGESPMGTGTRQSPGNPFGVLRPLRPERCPALGRQRAESAICSAGFLSRRAPRCHPRSRHPHQDHVHLFRSALRSFSAGRAWKKRWTVDGGKVRRVVGAIPTEERRGLVEVHAGLIHRALYPRSGLNGSQPSCWFGQRREPSATGVSTRAIGSPNQGDS